jgi:hypothetical protein
VDSSAGHSVLAEGIARLSFVGLPVIPEATAAVFRLPEGGWGVSGVRSSNSIYGFDRSGAVIGLLGGINQRKGGHERQILAVSMRHELWVLDPEDARLSVFAADMRVISERRLNMHPILIAPSRDGRSILVSGSAFVGHMYYAVARILAKPGTDVFAVPLGRQPLPTSQWLIKR